MKPTPNASVLFLSYNQGEFVRQAIRSILAQENIFLEILVSDDSSNDESYRILQKEIASYRGPHTVILERNSRRLGHENIYHLAKKATCDFQIQAHSDDIALPSRCSKLWQAHLATGASIVTSTFQKIDVWGRVSPAEEVATPCFYTTQELFDNPHRVGTIGSCLSWHREILLKFPPLTLNYISRSRDFLCVMRGSLLGGAYCLSEPLLKYRQHPYQGSAVYVRESETGTIIRTINHLAWCDIVLRDLEWILANEPNVDQKATYETIYQSLKVRYTELSRQHSCDYRDFLNQGFRLTTTRQNRYLPWHIEILKMIPSSKVRQLSFLPREMKRLIISKISRRK